MTDVQCRSAGTFAFPGNSAAGEGIAVAATHGLDLEAHVARELAVDQIEWADRIIAMEPSHGEMAARLAGGTPIDVMTDFLPPNHASRGAGVPDPFGGDLDTYEGTFELLRLAMRGLFDALRDEAEEGASTL